MMRLRSSETKFGSCAVMRGAAASPHFGIFYRSPFRFLFFFLFFPYLLFREPGCQKLFFFLSLRFVFFSFSPPRASAAPTARASMSTRVSVASMCVLRWGYPALLVDAARGSSAAPGSPDSLIYAVSSAACHFSTTTPRKLLVAVYGTRVVMRGTLRSGTERQRVAAGPSIKHWGNMRKRGLQTRGQAISTKTNISHSDDHKTVG